MKIKNKKHIIFDWNGTLVDDAWVFIEILNTILINQKIKKINLKQYRSKFCFPIRDFYENLGVDISRSSFQQIEKKFVCEYKKLMYRPGLFSSTINTLTQLSLNNIKMSILSASNQSTLNKLVSYYKLNSFFKHVVGVQNHGAIGKGQAGASLLKKLDLKKKEVLLIGDTDYDYEIAKNLEIDCILVSEGHQSSKRLKKITKHVVPTLNHIMNDIDCDYL